MSVKKLFENDDYPKNTKWMTIKVYSGRGDDEEKLISQSTAPDSTRTRFLLDVIEHLDFCFDWQEGADILSNIDK
jgi:hypothetical protein